MAAPTHYSIYKDAVLDSVLEQGDLLEVTPELQSLLESYHSYFAQHPDNRFYAVLTQSCDLVRRAGGCAARYIAIAPVRPIATVIGREFDEKLVSVAKGVRYASHRERGEIERFLERLLNNNEPSYFYFEAEPGRGVYGPMCAVLGLSIPFKAEHYDELLRAKIIGVTDVFQAKLGWLLGQLYSRVGTEELPAPKMREAVKSLTEGLALWLEPPDVEALGQLVQEWRHNHPNETLDADVLGTLQKGIKKRKTTAIEVILEIAQRINLAANPSPQRRNLRLALENSAEFGAMFR